MKVYELWQQAFVQTIRSGHWNSIQAAQIADAAVKAFKERFEVMLVGEGEWDWREKP